MHQSESPASVTIFVFPLHREYIIDRLQDIAELKEFDFFLYFRYYWVNKPMLSFVSSISSMSKDRKNIQQEEENTRENMS